MSKNTVVMTQQLYDYYLSCSLREDPILANLRKETAKLSSSKMQIAPEQGQFMAFLVQLLGAKRTIDIGVYTGYSSLAVALALPADGKVIACDVNTEWTKIAAKYWQLASQEHKIQLCLAPASETLKNLIEEGSANKFDFIFIDADKKTYAEYYELSLQLLRKGGVIAIDNVLWGGRVADENDQDENTIAIREFNSNLLKDDRVSLTMIPIADGLTLTRKL